MSVFELAMLAGAIVIAYGAITSILYERGQRKIAQQKKDEKGSGRPGA